MDARLKRLIYQASYRGTREADLVLGRFARECLPDLGDDAWTAFEALIDAPDNDLMDWISGRVEAPAAFQGPVLDLLINFKNTRLNN
jgi:antitoxin CptB